MVKYEKENYNDLKVDLTNEILGDPMFVLGECDRIISNYKAHCPDIFDEYQKFEEEYRIDNEDEWDKEYFILLVLWFQSNFSLDRLSYIKKVGEKVYASERGEYEEALRRKNEQNTASYDQQSQLKQHPSNNQQRGTSSKKTIPPLQNRSRIPIFIGALAVIIAAAAVIITIAQR